MHNQLCQAQAWGHECTGPCVLQPGNFPAHKRCSVKENCHTRYHLFTILLSQVEEQPIHTVSEHAELEGRARTFSRDDQAPPRRHRYSKPFLQTDCIDSVSSPGMSLNELMSDFFIVDGRASHQPRVAGSHVIRL